MDRPFTGKMPGDASMRAAQIAFFALSMMLGAWRVHAAESITAFFYDYEGRAVQVDAVLPEGSGQVPAVLLLPGSLGFEPDAGTALLCKQYAATLSKRHMATFMVHFLEGSSFALPDGKTPQDRALRNKEKPAMMSVWVDVVRAAIPCVQDHPRVNPGRIGVLGFSLGASVAYDLSAVDSRVKAVVGFYGAMLSPDFMKNAGRMAPTLIFQGEADMECPPQNARELVAFLKSRRVPCELHLYPGLGHSFNKKEDAPVSRETLELTLGFFQKYLGIRKGGTP